MSASRVDNIFMVAADVRAVTFDEKKGVDEQGDHDGKDILRLAKHKIHVCWYGSDNALLLRRAEVWSNRGRAAIGRNGLYNDYSKKEDLIDHKGKLINKIAADELTKEGKVIGPWNETVRGKNYYLGHNYQTEDKALEYYLTSMKEYCDPDSDKC